MIQLSFSQLKLYVDYPLDYFFKYVKKYEQKNVETKWMDNGNAVHEVNQEYYNKSNLDWQNNCLEKWKKYKLEGRMNYDNFKKDVINSINLGIQPTEVEKKILISVTDNITFLGYLDVYSDIEDYIKDWKTGTYTKEKENEYKAQLLCYAWMFYKINKRLPKVCSIFFTKNSKQVDFTFTLEQVIKFENYVKKVGNEIIRKKALHKNAEQWGHELGYWSGYHYLSNLPTMNFKIEIRNSYCFLSGSISPLLFEGIDKETYFDLPGKYFMQKYLLDKGKKITNMDEVGRVHLFDKREGKFSIGLLYKIKKLITQYGSHKNCKVNINILDLRDKNVLNFKLNNMPKELITDKKLRPYQMDAISSYLRSEGMGFLEIATGGGKTLITAEIIRRLKTSTLWIIDKKELLHQTKKVFEEVLGQEMGIIGDGEFKPKSITVATIQSLNSKMNNMDTEFLKYLTSVNFAIIDEFHHSAADSYTNVFRGLINTKYRLGTTATARREDGKEPIMFSLVGGIIYKIGSQELIEQGYLIKPKITFYKLSEEIDFKLQITKETKKTVKKVEYSDEYRFNIMHNTERHNKLFEIVSKNKDKKMLIITKLVDHGKYLNENIPNSTHIYGSLDSKKRKELYKDFLDNDKGILIATTSIASEGLDIPDLQMIINASANKSDIKSIQALGRILRIIDGKKEAEYVDFLDLGVFGKKHSKGRFNIFKEKGYHIDVVEEQKDL